MELGTLAFRKPTQLSPRHSSDCKEDWNPWRDPKQLEYQNRIILKAQPFSYLDGFEAARAESTEI